MNNTLDLLCMGCFAQLSAPNIPCPVCGYVPPSDAEGQHRLAPSTVLSGKYMVGKPLGEGGFGITYLGYDLNLDIKVAIKEFYPFGFVTRSSTQSTTVQPLAGEQGEFFLKGRERFVDEAKRLAKFRTFPGIVMVNDFFVENGTAYIVMEYVEGETLKSYMAQQGGRLPADMVLAMMRPVFESLAQIHAEGLIHRDISPDNIMVTHSGEVKLLDFGAAREFGEDGNKSLSVMLKHGYAPPEQYTSRGVQGPHTDVYALCATIYKAVTGVTPDGSMDRLMEDRLVPPSVLGAQMPYHAEVALMHGLAVKAEHRWQTVGDLYSALYNSQLTIHNSQLPYPQDAAPRVYQQPVGGGVLDAPPPPSASQPVGATVPGRPFTEPPQPPNYTIPATAYPQPVGVGVLDAPPSQYGQPPSTSYAPQDNSQLASQQDVQQPVYAPQPAFDGRQVTAPTGEKEVKPHFEVQPTGDAIYPAQPQDDGLLIIAPTDVNVTPAPIKAKKPMAAAKRNGIIAAAVGVCVVIALVVVLATRQGAPIDDTQTDDTSESIGIASPDADVQSPSDIPSAIVTPDAVINHNTIIFMQLHEGLKDYVDVSDWQNIITVSTGYQLIVGLKADGTVVADGIDNYGESDVSNWLDILSISTGEWHNVGLKRDGTVVAVGYNENGECNVSDWQNIIAISAGGRHTVGLKSDGTVVAVGNNDYGQCDVSSWQDIVAISAGDSHTVGLKSDGTVVAIGLNGIGECDVSEWRDIVAISTGSQLTLGLRVDGTAVAVGVGHSDYEFIDVSNWRDIVAVSASRRLAIGLKSDGTVVAVGSNNDGHIEDASEWRDIIAVSIGGLHTVALQAAPGTFTPMPIPTRPGLSSGQEGTPGPMPDALPPSENPIALPPSEEEGAEIDAADNDRDDGG